MATVVGASHAELFRRQRLDEKVALVTGAGGELGHRAAISLGEVGASVALNLRGASSTRVIDTLKQLMKSVQPVPR